jgi:hypothetical protein
VDGSVVERPIEEAEFVTSSLLQPAFQESSWIFFIDNSTQAENDLSFVGVAGQILTLPPAGGLSRRHPGERHTYINWLFAHD